MRLSPERDEPWAFSDELEDKLLFEGSMIVESKVGRRLFRGKR